MDIPTKTVQPRLSALVPDAVQNVSSRLFSATVRTSTVALADQVVVSGTRFFVTLAIGRMCGPEMLGIYSLAFTFVVFGICALESLISLPYTVYGNRLEGKRRAQYAGSALVHCSLLAVVTAICLLGVGLLSLIGWLPTDLGPVVLILSAMVPFILLHEFCRQLSYSHLRTVAALKLDLAVAALQVSGLVALAASGLLTAAHAFLAVGLACLVCSICWLIIARREIAIRWNRVIPHLRQNVRFGRWVVANSLMLTMRSYAIPWLLALLVSTAAAGVFVACETVIALANPLLLGLGNVLPPMAARAFSRGGAPQVARMVFRSTLALSAAMFVVCGSLALAGDILLELMFGNQFAGNRQIIWLLALSYLLIAVKTPVHAGLCALERPDLNFKANFVGLMVTAVVSLLLIDSMGPLGAAWGLVAGSFAAVMIIFVAYRSITPPVRQEALAS